MNNSDSRPDPDFILTLDLGNTTLRGGLWHDNSLISDWSIPSNVSAIYSNLEEKIAALKEENRVDSVILASVVPDRNHRIEEIIGRLLGRKCYLLTSATPTGLTIRYDRPRQVGADRIANSVGAFLTYGGPVIVVDFGTAITFDVVSADYEYLGGVIAPGLEISTGNLFQKAALLPKVKLSVPEQVLGRSTAEAIRSGVFWGTIGLVERVVRELKRELGWGEETRLVATGGHSHLIVSRSQLIRRVDTLLTLRGLYLIAKSLSH